MPPGGALVNLGAVIVDAISDHGPQPFNSLFFFALAGLMLTFIAAARGPWPRSPPKIPDAGIDREPLARCEGRNSRFCSAFRTGAAAERVVSGPPSVGAES